MELRQSSEPNAASAIGPLAIIWGRKWSVLLVLFTALAAAFAYLRHANPIYTATCRIHIEQNDPAVLRDMQPLFALSPHETFLNMQKELIRSTELMDQAAGDLAWQKLPTLMNSSQPGEQLRALTSVEVIKDDGSLSITCASQNADDAARMANSVAKTFMAYKERTKQNSAAEVLRLLEREKGEREQDLLAKLKEITGFKQKNGTISFSSSESGNVILNGLAKFTTNLNEAESATIRAKGLYDTATKLKDDPAALSKLMDTDAAASTSASSILIEVRMLQYRLQDAETRLTVQLGGNLGARNSIVRATEREIEELRKHLDDAYKGAAARYYNLIALEYERAKQSEDAYREKVKEQTQLALELNKQTAEFSLLEDEADRLRKLSDTLDNRIKDLRVTEDVRTAQVGILDSATVPGSPTSPQPTKTYLIALGVGLMLGVGCAFVQEWVDVRMRSVGDVRASLRIPILGVIPRILFKRTIQEVGQAVHLDATSDATEAYRSVQSALEFGSRNGAKPPRTIFISSAIQGEGKSVTVSNLAIAMSHAGLRTLILDCDLRRSTQREIFLADTDIGVYDVMSGAATLDSAILPTTIPGLDLLPAGGDPNRYDLRLSGQSLTGVLKQLSTMYDQIIVDGPPVTATADALVLAAACEGTVLLVRAGHTSRASAEEAIAALMGVNAKLMGTVVNYYGRARGRYRSRYLGKRRENYLPPERSSAGRPRAGSTR